MGKFAALLPLENRFRDTGIWAAFFYPPRLRSPISFCEQGRSLNQVYNCWRSFPEHHETGQGFPIYRFTELNSLFSKSGYAASAELMETIREQMDERRASVTYLKGNVRRERVIERLRHQLLDMPKTLYSGRRNETLKGTKIGLERQHNNM